MSVVLLLLLMTCSGGQVAYVTKAHVHMWWVKLPPTTTAHSYQIMDAGIMAMSNVVQVSSTPSQWSYAVHACWDSGPDVSICPWLEIFPEHRRTVYVQGLLYFGRNLSISLVDSIASYSIIIRFDPFLHPIRSSFYSILFDFVCRFYGDLLRVWRKLFISWSMRLHLLDPIRFD